jgi:hypothetical protein
MAMAEKREQAYRTEEQIKQEAKARREAEARVVPRKTSARAKKAENFWYHYKWHSIAAVTLVLLGVFFVRDIFFRPRPDATVVMVTGMPFDSGSVGSLEAALTALAPPNEKGGRLIAVDYINFIPGNEAPLDEMAMASSMKLMAVLASGTEYIYLLDESAHAYITGMGEGGSVFDGKSVPAGKLGLGDAGFGGLTFYIRPGAPEDGAYAYARELMHNIGAAA